MNKRSWFQSTGFIILAGAFLGILLGFVLPEAELSTQSSIPGPAATPGPGTPWPVSNQPTDAPLQLLPSQPAPPLWEPVKTGSPAPDFVLEDRAGNPVRLSDYRGSLVVINFWASWCPPCRDEMPDLQWLADEYADRGLVVLGLNTTYIDERSEALEFIDELGLTFPILFDETGAVGEDLYSVIALPTSYWIDPEGIVRHAQIGAMNREQMIAKAGQLLPQKED